MSLSISQAFELLCQEVDASSQVSPEDQIIARFEALQASQREPQTVPRDKPSGKGRPATLWVCDSAGNVRVEEYPSAKAAQVVAEKEAASHSVRWARAFNDKTGKVFIGEGWVYNPKLGDKIKNMPLQYWSQLTAPEKHKVKETEIPKYKKPGWECKDLSVKQARWQSVGTSRRGLTYDRRNNSQGIPYKHRADFGEYPFAEK